MYSAEELSRMTGDEWFGLLAWARTIGKNTKLAERILREAELRLRVHNERAKLYAELRERNYPAHSE